MWVVFIWFKYLKNSHCLGYSHNFLAFFLPISPIYCGKQPFSSSREAGDLELHRSRDRGAGNFSRR